MSSQPYLALIDHQTNGARCDVTPLFGDYAAFSALLDDLAALALRTRTGYGWLGSLPFADVRQRPISQGLFDYHFRPCSSLFACVGVKVGEVA